MKGKPAWNKGLRLEEDKYRVGGRKQKGRKHPEEQNRRHSEKMKGRKGRVHTQEIKNKIKEKHIGLKASSEAKKNMREGMKNTMWITNGKENEKIKIGDIVKDGFKPGKTNHKESHTVLGRECYTNGVINKLIKPGQHIPEGFIKGSWCKGDRYHD